MLSEHTTLTKRQIGWLLMMVSVLGALASLGVDVFNIVQENGVGQLFSATTLDFFRSPLGIGPTQQIGLILCAVGFIIGLTLIPLGDDPA